MADSHRPSYRLDRVPWIGVLYADGTTGELSLRDALARAAEIAGLVCDMPQQELPIVRVCLAVLYRALGEPGMGEDAALDLWEGMWRQAKWSYREIPCDDTLMIQ